MPTLPALTCDPAGPPQGIMLSDSNERMDSLSLLMYMAPVAVVALIPTTLFFEPDAAALAMKLGKDGCECGAGGASQGGRAVPASLRFVHRNAKAAGWRGSSPSTRPHLHHLLPSLLQRSGPCCS